MRREGRGVDPQRLVRSRTPCPGVNPGSPVCHIYGRRDSLIHRVVMSDSGGAMVFAARGKRLCCRPRLSDQFQNFGHGVRLRTNRWGSTPLPSLLIPVALPFPTPSPPVP